MARDLITDYAAAGARKERLRRRAWKPPASSGSPRPYVELRAASAFSFLDGASLPEDLVEGAAACGLDAVALVDTNGVYGAPRFYTAAQKAGVRGLVGAELVLESGWDELRFGSGAPGGLRLIPDVPGSAALSPAARITLLVESQEGYRNLCRLITAGALRHEKGKARYSWDVIAEHSSGLHLLTGGDEGALAAMFAREGADGARRLLERLAHLFPGRTSVELQRHLRRDEEVRNQALVDLASQLRLPMVATNGIRYARPADRELFDILTCVREGTTVDLAGRKLHANRERHFKSPREMSGLFADLPHALDGTIELASRLGFTLADLGYRFPEYPLPPGETPMSFLRYITWNGARARFRPLSAKAQAQIEKELAMIEKLELAGYFLIVWDIVRFCIENQILVQGRGSAANSAVCYALSITAIDPVKMELLFERFLSEERGEWPDIDLDLPSGDQREKVIQYVYKRYGVHGSAMTANVITYRERSAARDVGKALGFSQEQVDRFAKKVGRWAFGEIRDKVEQLPGELAEIGLDTSDVRVRHLVDHWARIQNLPRHLGQHSGGMVMARGRLDEVVPLEPASMPGRVVIQWDKDDCADLGIIKVDLLGLGMLQAIEEMIPMIHTSEGVRVDLAHLPQDDPKVYRMLNEADTIGTFQVESRAQMASLPRNAPKNFYDIVIQVAIIRPGPIVGGMVNPFFERRQGKRAVEYAHPSLEPILRRTLGVPLFQEQLLRMAMVTANFTGGEAEELRRAMGFKRSMERMSSIEERLRSGMTDNGIDADAQEQIIRSITSFALYGFPESHAASFALIAYASTYLKAHHPTAFYVSLLNAWPMGFYHPATLVKDAQRRSVEVRPVDVVHSGWMCSWEPRDDPRLTPSGAVRLGLRYVKGLRATVGRTIEEQRRIAPFLSVDDLACRAALRPDDLEKLATAGALASFGLSRRAAMWQASKAARDPGPLFREDEAAQLPTESPLAEMSALQETLTDYDSVQLTAGPHLMSHFRKSFDADGIVPASVLQTMRNGSRVRTAGSVIVRQRPGTAKGFVFLTLEDETGMMQAIVRPDLFQLQRNVIVGAAAVIVEGTLQNEVGQPSIRADRFWPLETWFRVPSHDFH